jgi:hypothetical protein
VCYEKALRELVARYSHSGGGADGDGDGGGDGPEDGAAGRMPDPSRLHVQSLPTADGLGTRLLNFVDGIVAEEADGSGSSPPHTPRLPSASPHNQAHLPELLFWDSPNNSPRTSPSRPSPKAQARQYHAV